MSPEFWQAFTAAEFPPQKGRALLEALGPSPSIDALLAHSLLTETERKRIAPHRESSMQTAQDRGISVLTADAYPYDVEPLLGAPPAIWTWGDRGALDHVRIAIVGTRSATPYGKACAQKFAEAFVRAGVTVVSGGALGIDAAAHQGALAHDGRTIAVLAGGVDHVYPAVHAGLFSKIRERGCLVSQFPVGSTPAEYRFLVRNHLIAALSSAVLVVEAPYRSGAISTARDAAEYGREVFVVPGSIDMASFYGSFNLIRDGATLVHHPDQVLEAMGIEAGQPSLALAPASEASASPILPLLGATPVSAEMIVEKSGLTASEVLSELTILELDGLIISDRLGYCIRP